MDYEVVTLVQHAKTKGMWAGALSRVNLPLNGFVNNQIVSILSPHTPAILKIFDEVVVNALDRAMEFKEVTQIRVTFENGTFSCFNDGPGFPIRQVKVENRNVYIPELASCYFLAGTNMQKSKQCIKGGTNGVGLKLANVHSKKFTLCTVNNRQKYTQITTDRLQTIHSPIIEPTNAPNHSIIEFTPAYQELGYSLLTEQDRNELSSWLYLRCIHAAVYVPHVEVTYNGNKCISSLSELVPLYVPKDSSIYTGTVAPSWRVAAAVSPVIKHNVLTIINGVVCLKGNHINFVKKQIAAAVTAKIQKLSQDKNKKVTTTQACKNMFLFIVGTTPGVEWTGQRKDELMIADSILARTYTFPPSWLQKVATTAAEFILRKTKKLRAPAAPIAKYTRSKEKGVKTRLLAAEGDSAIAFLREGLTLRESGPSFEYYGIISLGGVIMNAIKKSTITAEGYVIQSEQLVKNETLSNLVTVLGLEFNKKYTHANLSQLKYGKIIGCVDQDLDGCGKILSLLLVYFYLFWPELIALGYIQWFMTPVIRAYYKSECHEFFFERDFQAWWAQQTKPYTIKYYKGLAAHNKKEIAALFKKFDQLIYTFTLDDAAGYLFDIYFGKRPDLRKTELMNGPNLIPAEEQQEMANTKTIKCSSHLKYYTQAYKLDALERQLPSVLDGLTRTRRKVLAAAMRGLNSEKKVFQFGGYVAENMFYHHGDTSLNTTIIGMMQSYLGAHRFPLLIGIGCCGTRHRGIKDAGSPRYISVKLNSALTSKLFPKEDMEVLPYVYEDGERSEPKFYVPVLPYALLEAGANPSEGWKFVSWAQDYHAVVKLVLENIENGTATTPLQIDVTGFKGRVVTYRGQLYTVGVYLYYDSENCVVITELPLRQQTGPFVERLLKNTRKELIERVDDYSGSEINIRVFLTPGALPFIEAHYGNDVIDPIEDFLLLRNVVGANLNFISPTGGVVELNNYHAIHKIWYEERKKLYLRRLERQNKILEWKILLEKNILAFLDSNINLLQFEDESCAEEALVADFVRLNAARINAPAHWSVDELNYAPSYEYIFQLQERDFLHVNKQKRIVKLQSLKEQKKQVEEDLSSAPFPGARIWKNEIQSLYKVLQEL